ncbi:hypothetical protein IEO21_05098 [Rhodonia placenta]|uniref:HIT domain-containing protein n=1 Tax=Rhodonia placenta TaxID=104341 RepID=A0A8H7P2M3_9APHY|nr:hypothetical protein IEO21_05098 [Postia placenta]
MFLARLLGGCFARHGSEIDTQRANRDKGHTLEDGHKRLENCIFCNVSVRNGFDVVWENDDFIAFRDHNPSATHHFQVITKQHIDSVKSLSKDDVSIVGQMCDIGHRILEELDVSPTLRRFGFHVPPFNSVMHLHMHVQALPYRSVVRALKYPVVSSRGGLEKGFSWFVTADQSIRILDKGRRIGVLPC